MKKLFKRMSRLMVVMALALLLSACAPVASAYVQLDPALATWIVIGATVVVGYLFAKAQELPFVLQLLAFFRIPPEKVEQYRMATSAWLAGIVVQFLQASILDRIPSMWDNVVTIVMQLIVAVLVTLYTFRRLADRNVKSFRTS